MNSWQWCKILARMQQDWKHKPKEHPNSDEVIDLFSQSAGVGVRDDDN